MSDIVLIIEVLMFILVISLVGYYFYSIQRKRKYPEGNSFVILFSPQFTKGHAMGRAKIERGERRVKILVNPRDINYMEELNKRNMLGKLKQRNFNLDFKPIPVFYDKKLLIDTGLSNNVKLYFALPQKKEDLPEDFRRCPLGKWVEGMIEEIMSNKDKEDLDGLRMKKLKKTAERTYGAGIFDEALSAQREIFEKALETSIINKEKKDE